MDSTFSSSDLTKYTNGYCHLLSWTLKNYFGLESSCDIQIVELVEGSNNVQHSLICVSQNDDSNQKFFLDICGKYPSEKAVLDIWERITPAEEERSLRYLPLEIEKEKWWSDLGCPYTIGEQQETEEFVINHSDMFQLILMKEEYITAEDCKKIKEKLWDDDASFEIDVRDVIKNILNGNYDFIHSIK